MHLVRDPRGVAWSGVKKAGRRGARPLLPLRSASAALGWWIANLACELFGSKYPDRYVRLRYEDLARSPGEEMRGLFAKLAPGLEWSAEAIGANDNRHQLYGNRMRAANLSLAEVREDAAWQRDMPRLYRSLVSLLTAPLRWRYGYLGSRERARRMRVARWRNRNQEVHHASQIGSATKGRRCRALRQARKDEPEQAQGRIAQHVQIDERETARRVPPRPIAKASRSMPRSTARSSSRSTARKSPTRKSTARKTTARKTSSRHKSSR